MIDDIMTTRRYHRQDAIQWLNTLHNRAPWPTKSPVNQADSPRRAMDSYADISTMESDHNPGRRQHTSPKGNPVQHPTNAEYLSSEMASARFQEKAPSSLTVTQMSPSLTELTSVDKMPIDDIDNYYQ